MTDFDKRLSIGSAPRRPGWDELLKSELSNILESGHFDKSPTLQRLLIYLVSETIRGGEKLKSYVVAVDGLGKDPQFDSHADSYPRVQVMRLRKMLEGYYTRHHPMQDLCIHIPAGSYEVKLARAATAYPEIFSRLTTDPGSAIAGTRTANVRASGPVSFHPQRETKNRAQSETEAAEGNNLPKSLIWIVSLLLISTVVAGYLAGFGETSNPVDTAGTSSADAPLLILDRPTAAGPESQAVADEAYAKLADSLGRSWAVRLSLTESVGTAPTSSTSYHLAIQIGELRAGKQAVYLRLTQGLGAELIWSTSVTLDPEKTLADNLGKSVAQVAGPFGIIAARETDKANGDYRQGYTCLLGYMKYLNTRKPELLKPLSTCLAQPIETVRLDAVRLALRSFHIVATAEVKDRPAAIASAMSIAQQAIQTDSKEAYAHFAMARIQYVTNQCAKGVLHTAHAAQANPYDPVILAVLGNFAAQCGDPSGEILLERAFNFRSPGESYARLSLILSVIRNGQIDRLPALSAEAENMPGINAAYHHLCETLVAAAVGDRKRAISEWRKFSAASAAPQGNPDSMMRDVVLSPQIRRKIITYLTAKGVLPADKQQKVGVTQRYKGKKPLTK